METRRTGYQGEYKEAVKGITDAANSNIGLKRL